MRVHSILIVVGAAGATLATGCKNVDCGAGTIEQGGACVPANETVTPAQCGPFTMLVGDVCTPMFDPTTCDPTTTVADRDPTTGVTTCIGNGGGGGCGSPFACPAPSTNKQTICGQIYDLESGMPFQTANPVGAQCGAGATSGPCAVEIKAFDAVAYSEDPINTSPQAVGSVYIDDCGRYRMTDITPPGGPFLALGFDDAAVAMHGPTGVTNAVGIATVSAGNTATKDFEGFIVSKATTDLWTASGGPTIAAGIDVDLFRAHKTGFAPQAGVTATRGAGTVSAANDFYFHTTDINRDMLDPAANATGANGTALIANAPLGGYSGQGGVDATCDWESHSGATVAGVVFVQIFRPIDASGMTCDQ